MTERPKIVMMANQIASFFAGSPDAAGQTADHIRKFWDPRMRAQLKAHLLAGGAGLKPVARAAAEQLSGAPATSGA